jgi:hypothetical protein
MSLPEPSESLRQARLDEVLAEYMDRVDAGEVVDRATVVAAHPDLATVVNTSFSRAPGGNPTALNTGNGHDIVNVLATDPTAPLTVNGVRR